MINVKEIKPNDLGRIVYIHKSKKVGNLYGWTHFEGELLVEVLIREIKKDTQEFREILQCRQNEVSYL